ncbi:MAG: SpoIIE family protein phosphatase [Sporichthyaceae bacterium]
MGQDVTQATVGGEGERTMPARWRTTTMKLHNVVVEVCWRPVAGEEGGDLHEVVDLHDGRIAIAVGDTGALGTEAGGAADDLRVRIRRVLRKTQEPAALLAELDAAMERHGGDHPATLVCAVLDPAARVVRVANAGHPPLIFVEGVAVELYDGLAGPPLGGLGGQRREFARKLTPDTSLFLYTDGLVVRPGTEPAAAFAELLEACRGIGGASAWASEFARRANDRLGQPVEDATVVSVRMAVQANPVDALEAALVGGEVLIRAYVDPNDLRTRGLVEVLARLDALVPDVDVAVEVIDVTSRFAMTEEAGVLAAPTVLRALPEPAVRVIGWFDSPSALARALHLPVTTGNSEGTV